MNAIRGVETIDAVELTTTAKEQFSQVRSLQDERVKIRDKFSMLALWVGLGGVAVGVAGVVCAATVFPLKTEKNTFYGFNQSTGQTIVSEGASDAPKLFNDQIIEGALQTYVEARENYLYQTDPIGFHRATIMSSPEEQVRYKEMHDAPNGPSRALRDKGYVQVSNFQFFKLGTGKEKTLQYAVKFDRIEMRAGEPVPMKGDPYTATIDFQFHPEYFMPVQDRRLNVWGLWVVSYRPKSDDQSRKTN